MIKYMEKLSQMFIIYFKRFIFRFLVFLSVVAVYVFNRSLLDFTSPWTHRHLLAPAHFIWIIIFIELLVKLSPNSNLSIGCLKQYRRFFKKAEESYDKREQQEEIRDRNRGASKVLGFWAALNLIIGTLYLKKIIGIEEMVLVCAAYYLSDLICVMFFCPFQKFLMKNKCCATCRIFAWGEAMITTPLVFIRHMYSWSLFGIAMVIAIRWEQIYHKYPERFFEKTNLNLRCGNCTDKLCKAKI